MLKPNLNPPTEGEDATQNVKNAWAMLLCIEEEPDLFTADDIMQTIKAANVRLKRAVQQMGG